MLVSIFLFAKRPNPPTLLFLISNNWLKSGMEIFSDFAISASVAFNPFQMASLRVLKSADDSSGRGLKRILVLVIPPIHKDGRGGDERWRKDVDIPC